MKRRDIMLLVLPVTIVVGIIIITISQVTPPIFIGYAYIDGNPAVGEVITAWIGSIDCTNPPEGAIVDANGIYGLAVYWDPSVDPVGAKENCGTEGATIKFKIGNRGAAETATWHAGGQENLNLNNYTTGPPATCIPGADCTIPACTGWDNLSRNPSRGHDPCPGPNYNSCVRDSGVGYYNQACCGGKVSSITTG